MCSKILGIPWTNASEVTSLTAGSGITITDNGSGTPVISAATSGTGPTSEVNFSSPYSGTNTLYYSNNIASVTGNRGIYTINFIQPYTDAYYRVYATINQEVLTVPMPTGYPIYTLVDSTSTTNVVLKVYDVGGNTVNRSTQDVPFVNLYVMVFGTLAS